MAKTVLALAALLALSLLLPAAGARQATRTMRLDFYHTGTATEEVFSLDRAVVEPLAWPGNPRRAVDDSNLGKYLFEVRDVKSDRVLYSRGFASIYGEWETTDEARAVRRTFQESLRFPAPDAPVKVVLKKRDQQNLFREVWAIGLDPSDIFVDRSPLKAPAPLIEIQKNGDSASKVDFLIIGDGYTATEQRK